jgi:hypothetical protein
MYHLGEWYKKMGQQDVTVAVWRELLQSSERADDKMMLLLSLGEVLTDEKRYDEAVELYQAAIAQNPSNVFPREGLAELHRKKGSYREAAEIYEDAIEREPMRFGLWFRICKLYLDTGNLASAIRVCTQEIKKRPSNPSPVMILSNVYASQGHYHSAIREYMNFTDRTEFSAIEDNLKTALAEVNDPWVASTFIGVRDVLRRWTTPLDQQLIASMVWGTKGTLNMNSVKRSLSGTALLFLGPEKTPAPNDLYLSAWTGSGYIASDWPGENAQVPVPDPFGTTALHLAVWNMHDEVVKYLLIGTRKEAWVSWPNQDLVFALHLAAWNDDGEMIERLLEAGAEISVQDKNGLTPLHWAARHGNIKAIDVLVSSGADVDIRDKQGWQPIHQAEIHGQPVAIGILSYVQKRVEERRIDARRSTPPRIALSLPVPTPFPPPGRTTPPVRPPARPPPNRDNGAAQSHVGEPPKDGSRKVRVTGKVL